MSDSGFFPLDEMRAARQREEARTEQLAQSLTRIICASIGGDDVISSVEVLTEHPTTVGVELASGDEFFVTVEPA